VDGDAGLMAAAAANPICLWCEGEFDCSVAPPVTGSAIKKVALGDRPLIGGPV
jgi:hypothetical protein